MVFSCCRRNGQIAWGGGEGAWDGAAPLNSHLSRWALSPVNPASQTQFPSRRCHQSHTSSTNNPTPSPTPALRHRTLPAQVPPPSSIT